MKFPAKRKKCARGQNRELKKTDMVPLAVEGKSLSSKQRRGISFQRKIQINFIREEIRKNKELIQSATPDQAKILEIDIQAKQQLINFYRNSNSK